MGAERGPKRDFSEEVEDRRRDKGSAFDEFRDVIESKAAMPGVTKKAIHELGLDRMCAAMPDYVRMVADGERDFAQADLFCACQPVEEVARTGHDTLRHGALKPVGLVDPRTGRRPWAVVQLRAENAARTAYNLVGFQTNLTWPEQRRVFRLIPGLGSAEFLRYGVMHRNSFVDAPHALDRTFAIPGTQIRLAGQITGTEGYVEAIASGLLAALNVYAELTGAAGVELPATGSLGSLVRYATDPATSDYQPMHVNFGLFPPLAEPIRNKAQRRAELVRRGRRDLADYLTRRPDLLVPPEGSGEC